MITLSWVFAFFSSLSFYDISLPLKLRHSRFIEFSDSAPWYWAFEAAFEISLYMISLLAAADFAMPPPLRLRFCAISRYAWLRRFSLPFRAIITDWFRFINIFDWYCLRWHDFSHYWYAISILPIFRPFRWLAISILPSHWYWDGFSRHYYW